MFTHILDATDDMLAKLFKENAGLARGLIEDKRQRIRNGEISDDYSFTLHMMDDYVCDEWKLMEVTHALKESELFKYSQHELKKMSVGQLNIVQGWLSLEQSIRYRLHKQVEERNRGNVKFGKTSIKKLESQYEKLANLWNEILADDVMTPEELRMLTEKVHSYRIYSSDFSDFENYVYQNVLTKDKIDAADAMRVYEYMVEILGVFKERIEYKRGQEENHLQ